VRYSQATGVLFLASFLGVMAGRALIVAIGGSLSVTVIGLWIGVVLAWIWISLAAARLMTGAEHAAGSSESEGHDRVRMSLGREAPTR
jgi:hypothetical protein